MTIELLDAPVSTEIAEYSPTAAALVALRARLENVAYDVSTIKGLDVAKKDRAEVRDLRVALEKKRVELKAPALERSRLIDAEAKALTAELTALEKPIDDQIKAEERRKEAEKAAREQAEREAAARVQTQIDTIRRYVAEAVGKSATQIRGLYGALSPVVIDLEGFGERAGEAEQARRDTLNKLEEMLAAAEAHEAEQARLIAEREELTRQRAEQEAKDKAERERIAAEQAAEAARLAEQRRAFEQEQAAARAEAQAREDADRARRDEEDRKAREARASEDARIAKERAELEAQQRAVREAEEARAAATRKAEQDKADKAAAAERKRLDKVAADERERELKELRAMQAEAMRQNRIRDAAPAMFDALRQWQIGEDRPDAEELAFARTNRDQILTALEGA